MNMLLLTFLALKAKYKWGSEVESHQKLWVSTWSQVIYLLSSEREGNVRIYQSFLSQEINVVT